VLVTGHANGTVYRWSNLEDGK
jgi:hypothetical protein